jgi:hypothetical protein
VTDEASASKLNDLPDVSRRRFLAGAGGTLTGVAAVRAVDNVLLGYGELGYGTNLLEQELRPLVTENLGLGYDEQVSGTRLRLAEGTLEVSAGDGEHRFALDADARAAVGDLDAELGLSGRLGALYADASDVSAGGYEMAFSQPGAFFERVAAAEPRPDLVGAMRGWTDRLVDPDVVEEFADAPPGEPAALVDALVGAFREHATYDVTRYVAGSIQDNVIFGAAELRSQLSGPVTFEAMLENDDTGLFCYELAVRSMEALHAVAPWHQQTPVATVYVRDARHKHVYTGIASAIREDGDLVVPMTFVDYTHSTLYDDLGATPVMGRGLAAYDDRHRATEMYW